MIAMFFTHVIVILVLRGAPEGAASILVADVALALVTVIFAAFAWHHVKPQLQTPGVSLPLYALVIAGSLVTVGCMLVWVGFIRELIGLPHIRLRELFGKNPPSFPVMVIFIAVFPAVFEELAFRGVMQGVMRTLSTKTAAIVVTAILFSLIHFQFLNLGLVVLAFYLGLLREWTGSLYPGMVAHFCHNFLALVSEEMM